jgi:hypothetical protein
MPMKKLTLSADPEVIEQAKRLAEETGTSVSSLFERLVRLLARKRLAKQQLGRITRKASGLVTLPRGRTERDVLADALAEKYGVKK